LQQKKTPGGRSTTATTLAAVLPAVVVAGLLVLTASGDLKAPIEDLTVAAASLSAAAISIPVMLGQKTRHGYKPFLALSVGLALWAVAEILWAYFELVAGIEVPYPSVPDIFYLSGYAFVALFLFSLYRVSPRAFENKMVVIVIAITVESFFLNFFLIQLVENIVGFAQPTAEDWLLLAVSVAYPLLDGILLVPAAVLITGYQLGIMSRFSILLFAAAVVLFAVGDTGFSYFALTDFAALQDEKVWNTFYAVSYVLFAGSLLSVLLEMRASPKQVGGIKAGATKDYY
jgi:hypothetical protein